MDLYLAVYPDYQAPICGVDEAGRGPCAGPVVAAAVILPEEFQRYPWYNQINDSKKLTRPKREKLYDLITTHCVWAVRETNNHEIDRINILQATMMAMQRAVSGLALPPQSALIDGNRAPELNCAAYTFIGGDAKILQIAAASIIAKVTRDRIMDELAKDYPHYGWDRNAGYPTAEHLAALTKYGISPHHRKSYAPVRALLSKAV